MNKLIKKFVKKYETSAFWGMHFLPRRERLAAYTMCAFCRHIDDIKSKNTDIAEQKELLDAWNNELDNIYDKKQPVSVIGRNIYKNCMRFNIPKQDLKNFLNAVLMDFPHPISAPSLSDFKKYCEGVAGSRCSMYLRILGCNDEKLIADASSSLGIFLQSVAVLKNVKEDILSGHLYIPQEFLQKAKINCQDIEGVLTDKNLSIAREELSKTVEENYMKILGLLPRFNKKIRKKIKALINVCHYCFSLMERRGWEIISPKPQISVAKKIMLISKAYLEK